jgi:hypothetical protein
VIPTQLLKFPVNAAFQPLAFGPPSKCVYWYPPKISALGAASATAEKSMTATTQTKNLRNFQTPVRKFRAAKIFAQHQMELK